MGFFDSIGGTFKSVFQDGIYDHLIQPIGQKAYDMGNKAMDRFDKLSNLGDHTLDAAGGAVNTLDNLFNGKSNILLYAGLGLMAVLIVPKLVDKVL